MTPRAPRPVALVTGAARGIGRAVALALAEAGHDVAVADRSGADPSETLTGIEAVGGNGCFAGFDLADLDSHGPMLAQVEQALGPVDVLVNNAGIGAVVRGDLLDMKVENFDRVLDVNLRGTLFLTQRVVRSMLAVPSNHPRAVITVTSVSATHTSPERAEYCISKAGLAMFVQNLALRLAGTDIGVFEVRPGIIRSDMTAAVSEKYDRLIEGGLVPAGRWGEGSDIARAVVALASGAFAFSTGAIIGVDGGLAIARL
jgi:NAD(P)-dependent dehydrogenase (short-subunit alcohol dehydrogenase family)